MSEKRVIVDVGCGAGGLYMRFRNPRDEYVGIDIDEESLTKAHQTYGIETKTHDVGEAFPFTDGSVSEVKIILPCNDLLFQMLKSPSFWGELARITHTEAVITIIMEVLGNTHVIPRGRFRSEDESYTSSQITETMPVLIEDPLSHIRELSQAAGFSLDEKDIKKLSALQLLAVGTSHSRDVALGMLSLTPATAYEVKIHKHRQRK